MSIFIENKLVRIGILSGLSLLATGCATQSLSSGAEPSGFLLGLFHGFTILFSLIGSTFLDVEIYAIPNTGLGYDIGYFIGASSFLGGGAAGARGGRRKTDKK